ncbi:MBL fold metallo-hydrolase RNA specificity domain-containing protein [Owenweeksia hongkongensis]|uniref:MBL fold metallo-hydrolase RNA specificity domain-containing protein n=1 Tax=Owenweeksia hongkongensis TaxID=253245 RepID=UPI003A945F34
MKPNSLSLTFLGAAGTVTGSKTLLTFSGTKILIDCGLFQGIKSLRKQNWGDLDLASDVSDIILTHAHLDHSGYLPRLVKQGFKGQIHCTPITAKLVHIILLDSAKIQEEDAERANRKKYSKHEKAEPLYTTEDVHHTLNLIVTHEYNEWMVPGPDLRFTFIQNGHIPGSAMVEVHAGVKKIVFSGDLGRLKPLIMPKPKPLPEADLLILESTYGDRLHGVTSAFDQIKEAVNLGYEQKGQILIPSFAVERTQEILYILLCLIRDKKIPSLRIYLDSPMATEVTKVLLSFYEFLKDPELRDIMNRNLEIVSDYRASQAIVAMEECKIVIAGSGMITGGRILHHLEAHISKPSTVVILPGFQALGTRGSDLVKGVPEIKFFGKYYKVKARITQLDSLSAHADRNEILEWVKHTSKLPQRIILNHGEETAAHSLKLKLEHELEIPVLVATPNMHYVMDF